MYTKSGKQHRELITDCAAKQSDIHKHVDLMIRLVTTYSDHISNIGPQMADKLLNDEKNRDDATPINECRQILVNQVLPVILNSGMRESGQISPKQYYKWFQKALEYTTVHAVQDSNKSTSELIKGKIYQFIYFYFTV